MFSHFRLQEFWGSLIPADVFTSEVAKVLPGSIFPKIPEARKCENIGSDQIFGKFDPCQCCRISGFQEFWENSSLAALWQPQMR